MCLPVLYRTDGESRWHEGVTVDLSPGGALIEGEMPASRSDTIVVVIPLLSSDGCLIGRAWVVRGRGIGESAEAGRFAIAVEHYDLHRQSAVLARLDTLHQEC
jgi:hypothetical protein